MRISDPPAPDALRGPEYLQRTLAAMHQVNHERLPYTLEHWRV